MHISGSLQAGSTQVWMGWRRRVLLVLLLAGMAQANRGEGAEPGDYPLPSGFIEVRELIPDLVLDLRYFSPHNFVGRPIDGYLAERCVMTMEAAKALAKVQVELRAFGLGLKVFDAYRPQRGVDHFVRWAEDLGDTRMKAEFYPDVDKSRLFEEGYIAERSGHTRGSTVDLTIVIAEGAQAGAELDMGSPYDFFGPESWPAFVDVPAQARANRLLLRSLMVRHGFRPYEQEWWHFTLESEPYPDTYFDFPIY